jgi:ATP-dependent Clp protease protease subunit
VSFGLPPELQAALLDKRQVFLRGRLDDTLASTVISQLLLLGRTAADGSIDLYVDSPGGTVGAALAVYDFIRTMRATVSTTCLGQVSGAAVLVLAGGAAGRRFAMPHARIQLAEPEADQLADVQRMAAEATRQRERWLESLAQHTAHSSEHVASDLSNSRWLSAGEARDYGLVDGIVPWRA